MGGKREGAGRKKGIPNKLTSDIKAAISQAFDEVGSYKYLVKLSKENPQAFCMLLAKLVPPAMPDVKGGGGLFIICPVE